jgi:hypothetical protein
MASGKLSVSRDCFAGGYIVERSSFVAALQNKHGLLDALLYVALEERTTPSCTRLVVSSSYHMPSTTWYKVIHHL